MSTVRWKQLRFPFTKCVHVCVELTKIVAFTLKTELDPDEE